MPIQAAAAPISGEQRLENLEAAYGTLRGDMQTLMAQWAAKETTFLNAVNDEFGKHKAYLGDMVEQMKSDKAGTLAGMTVFYEQVRSEFQDTQSKINLLYQMTDKKTKEIEEKFYDRDGDRGGQGHGKGAGSHKDYIPTKNNIPKPFADKIEEWRIWQE